MDARSHRDAVESTSSRPRGRPLRLDLQHVPPESARAGWGLDRNDTKPVRLLSPVFRYERARRLAHGEDPQHRTNTRVPHHGGAPRSSRVGADSRGSTLSSTCSPSPRPRLNCVDDRAFSQTGCNPPISLPAYSGAIDRSLRHRSGRTTPGSGPLQRARQDVATFRRATGRVTGTLPDARFGSIAARTAVRLPRRRRTKLSARRPDVPASRRPCVRTVSWGTAVVSPIGAAHRSGSPHECDASRVRRRSSPMQASSRPLRRSPCR